MTIESDRSGTTPQSGGAGNGPPGTSTGEKTETAKAEAAQVATKAKEAGKEVIDEVTGKSAEVATTARGEFDRLLGQATTEVKNVGRERGQQLASRLDSWAQQMRALSEGRVDEAGELRSWMQQAQQRMEGYASSLRERGPDGLLQDVRRFARRRPAVFLLAAGVTGFAIGRMVRSGAMNGSQQSPRDAALGYGSNGRYPGSRGTADELAIPVGYSGATGLVVESDESLPAPTAGTRAEWPTQ